MTLLIGSGLYDSCTGGREGEQVQSRNRSGEGSRYRLPSLYLGGIDMLDVKRGQIYYTKLDSVIGSEQGGVRPVVILQNNKGNRFCPTTIVATVTSRKEKGRVPVHIPILADGLSKESVVHLEQIRTIDKQRLMRYVGWLGEPAMRQIDRAIEISLGLRRD